METAARQIGAVNYWLVKSEPGTYSWVDLVRERRTAWTGVRNFQARNNLQLMKSGDYVLFYHSGESRELVGLAQVAQEGYPDPTGKDGDWACVDLTPVKPLVEPVGLARIKADTALQEMVLAKNSRLSVQSVTKEQLQRILKLARTKL